MAVRLQTQGVSINGEDFWVKIIDTDYDGEYMDMSVGPNILIETQGNDRDLTEHIFTTTATIDLFINTEQAGDFFDDLVSSPEGRFYLQIDFQSDTNKYFLGRILSNGISIEDRKQPFCKLQAIDGLTLLKEIEFVPEEGYNNKMISIILNCLNNIDVIDKFFTASDTVIEAVTCLSANHAYFAADPYILKILRYNYYFFDVENKARNNWSCWDVLEEMLKRHMMTISYYKGQYFITGKDIFLSASTKQYIEVTKDYTITTSTWSGFYNIDIHDTVGGNQPYALSGGTYYFEPGIKSILMTTKPDWANANLSWGLFWDKTNTTYSDMGLMLGGTQYQTFLKVKVPNQFTPAQTTPPVQDPALRYFKIKFYFKALEWNGGDIDYPTFDGLPNNQVSSHIFLENAWNDPAREFVNEATETAVEVLFRYQNNNLEYGMNFIFPLFAIDTELQFRNEFIGFYDENFNLITSLAPGLSGFNYEITQEFGQYPTAKPDVIKFSAQTDTEDVEKKQIDIYAPNTYGQPFVKAILWNENVANNAVNSELWRFDSGDSYEGLEYAILRNYMRLFGPKQKYLDIGLNMTVIVPAIYNRLEYRNEYFICTKVSWDVHQATANITGIRIPTTEPNITVNLEAPPTNEFYLALDNPETPIFARAGGSIGTIIYTEFTGVTTSSVNLDAAPFLSDYLINFVQGLTEEQIRSRFEVYKDGIKQRYVPFDIPLTLDTRDFSLDWANNDVLINNDLGDSYTIEVKFLEV